MVFAHLHDTATGGDDSCLGAARTLVQERGQGLGFQLAEGPLPQTGEEGSGVFCWRLLSLVAELRVQVAEGAAELFRQQGAQGALARTPGSDQEDHVHASGATPLWRETPPGRSALSGRSRRSGFRQGALEGGRHQLLVCRLGGEELELARCLAQEPPATTNGHGPGPGGGAQELRVRRTVDGVEHERARADVFAG